MQNTASINRRRFIAGTSATVTGALAASSGANASETDDEATENSVDESGDRNERAAIIAHRGFADTYPENTVGAFELAARERSHGATAQPGTDWIELDVYPTCDGEIAVFHDSELGTLTDTTGVIYETPASDVFSAEVLESGQTIPTLAEAMDSIPASVGVNIDIKAGSSNVQFGRVDDPTTEREDWRWLETVLDTATDYENELLFSTFWEGALAAVRDIDPELPVAYLLADSIREGLDVTDEYETEAIHPPLSMISRTPFFDAESYDDVDLVAEAHDRGLPVNVWTIDTWHEVDQLIEAGVDGLILDHADVLHWGSR